jgi:hypothetical protein
MRARPRPKAARKSHFKRCPKCHKQLRKNLVRCPTCHRVQSG